MRIILAIVLTGLIFGAAQSQTLKKPKATSLEGTVVAVNTFWPLLGCYHVCGLSLIVRLDGNPTRYANVLVTYMDDSHTEEKGPQRKLIERSARWQFEVTLTDPPTAVLAKHWKTDRDSDPKIDAWRLLEGADNEKLPFGEVLLQYKVGVGKYKSTK